MARMSDSLPKMSAGTRMSPWRGTSHSYSDRRVNRLSSMTTDLHVHDRLCQPETVLLTHAQRRIRCSFRFDRRMVSGAIHGLSPGLPEKVLAIEPNAEAAEEHLLRGHLVDQCVQPVGKQQLVIRSSAFDVDDLSCIHGSRIRGQGRQRKRGLLEGLGFRCPDTPDAHVRLVREVLPVRAHDGLMSYTRELQHEALDSNMRSPTHCVMIEKNHILQTSARCARL